MKRIAKWPVYATIPAAVALELLHGNLVWQFVISCVAVLPLAAWIGMSTEQLAHRMGPTYGALFNATFGNFAEMIIAIFAIRAGLSDVVRASFAGSIVGNILFVAGLSMVVGGMRHETLKFNALAAESQAVQMLLAVAAMLVPALFFRSAITAHRPALIHPVSIGTAIILLITYICGLLFSFKTHRTKLQAMVEPPAMEEDEVWSMRKALALLAVASVLMGFVAEGLVHAVGEAGRAWGIRGRGIGACRR